MYMYLKVLSDPWRREFRERTGTSVHAVHEKKKKLNLLLNLLDLVRYAILNLLYSTTKFTSKGSS